MKACVIGAGPSGITAAKNLMDKGIDVVVFEKSNEVGGNWIFSEKISHSSVFETTHIISSKKLSQYEDYPMPEHYPDYPSHSQLAEYFQGYARHFGVYGAIKFNSEVKKAYPEQNKWKLEVEVGNEEMQFEFDYLLVSNGHHWNPRMPEYPGKFSGEFIHSHEFKKAENYRNKRVLVIGGGNSACDVAVETSRVSAFTHLSWRRGYWIVPKFLLGKPSDMVGGSLNFIPKKFRVMGFELLLKLLQGKNENIGLQKPDHHIFETHPTINSELYYFIRHGKIKPKKDIRELKGDKVEFVDGTTETYDVIIACTGFVIRKHHFQV
jgi:cation diffusion facilitator CzcD-associated flavoprotein CzcO